MCLLNMADIIWRMLNVGVALKLGWTGLSYEGSCRPGVAVKLWNEHCFLCVLTAGCTTMRSATFNTAYTQYEIQCDTSYDRFLLSHLAHWQALAPKQLDCLSYRRVASQRIGCHVAARQSSCHRCYIYHAVTSTCAYRSLSCSIS
jgi:hypothetical protein